MAKYLLLLLFVICLSSRATCQKIGYVDIDTVVAMLAIANKVDSIVEQYKKDSIISVVSAIVRDYQHRDSMLSQHKPVEPMPVISGCIVTTPWQNILRDCSEKKRNSLLQPM